MATLKELKSRTEGIGKINKIARAMEVIAATRLHRYEADILRFRPYVLAQRQILRNLALRLKKLGSFWTEPIDKKGIVILVSSDRGFCGGFNQQLFQLLKNFRDQQTLSFIAIGKKGAKYLKKQHFIVSEESALPEEAALDNFAQGLSGKIIASFRQEQQNIYLIFNRFRQHLLGRSCQRQLLPLSPVRNEILNGVAIEEDAKGALDYIFEPDAEAVLEEIFPLYVKTEIKAAVLESKAAEEMARMLAMTQATRSAEDLIKGLTLKYHKVRQAGITKELTEIANAIR